MLSLGIQINIFIKSVLFSEGVLKNRIDLQRFVNLTSTGPAKLYGRFPRKGSISIGADADLVIWNSDKKIKLSWEHLHDNVGYTPYEGMDIQGWPLMVLSRGRIVIADRELKVEKGSGEFIPREKPDSSNPAGLSVPEVDLAKRFGVEDLW